MPAGVDAPDDWTPRYDIGFDLTYRIHEDEDPDWGDLLIHFDLDYHKRADEDPGIADLVSDLSVRVYEGDIPDTRTEHHHRYTPPERWMKAHIYRLVISAVRAGETSIIHEYDGTDKSSDDPKACVVGENDTRHSEGRWIPPTGKSRPEDIFDQVDSGAGRSEAVYTPTSGRSSSPGCRTRSDLGITLREPGGVLLLCSS